ncbi:MAG TPA: hypothetical protein VE028_00165 [Nitratidesulfovibrio sp.]|nr:hypothetical protein [Nitratidesulfovibrio sp.]
MLETILGFFAPKPRLLGLVGLAVVLAIALAGVGVRCALLSADLKAEQAAHAATAERGQRELADLRAEHADENTDRALAVADAERTARLKLEAETARANTLATELSQTRKLLGDARRAFSKRLADYARAAAVVDPVYGPEFIRLYNEAIGLAPAAGAGGGPVPEDAAAAGTRTTTDTAGTAGPRLLPAAPGIAGAATVSAADILAHIRDYGGRCLALEAQVNGLIRFAEGQ